MASKEEQFASRLAGSIEDEVERRFKERTSKLKQDLKRAITRADAATGLLAGAEKLNSDKKLECRTLQGQLDTIRTAARERLLTIQALQKALAEASK